MLKNLLILALFVACTWASTDFDEEEDPARVFATLSTTTITTFKTAAVQTVSTSCATLVNASSSCRRRRGFVEQPIILSLDDDEADLSPSAPLSIEPTPVAELSRSARQVTPDIFTSNEDGLVELYVSGLKSCAEQRNFGIFSSFRLTIQVTSTKTNEFSSTTTKTNTFTIQGCTPAGITTCAASG